MATPEDILAKKIRKVYSQAAEEVQKKTAEFWSAHRRIAAEMLADVAAGKITQEDYKKWLRGQVFTGERWKQKLDDITKVYVDADKKAREIIGGTTKNVFVDFANRTAYDMEKDLRGGVSFDLYDGKTVERLLKDNPKMLPEWKIDEPKDYIWNEKRVQNAVTQGIVQGESIADIGKRLTSELATSNGAKMDMFARTAVTGAQNAGRIERLHEAEEMGIEVKKQWIATHDQRVRDTHAYLDGQIVGVDESFKVDGMEIDYPGDPLAPPELVYNCRCSLAYIYPKYQNQKRWEDQETGEEKEWKTFSEWKAEKRNEKHSNETDLNLESGEQTEKVLSLLRASSIQRLEVKPFENIPSRDEIVNRLAGGDMTKGSCASLSFAYAGNCAGFDVLDFRGGESLSRFSRTGFIVDIAQMEGVQSSVLKASNDIKAAGELLKGIEQGKDYILATGSHAAIVRKVEGGFEYLEMQSAKNSGWHSLDNDVLRWRFGCKRSHTFYGQKLDLSNVLIDVDSLGKNAGFQEMLSYINTSKGSQQKGALGHEK